MRNTYQFKNINMLDHGNMVHQSYLILLSELNKGIFLKQLNIDINENEQKYLLDNQYNINVMKNYHIYHDCGKPYCRIIDENGRQSFPNHAEISKKIYEQYFDNSIISALIEKDMNFHILKSETLEAWILDEKENKQLLVSLYLTAWSELLANSSMFGGNETDSFKIKKKQLIKAGKKLFSILFESKKVMNKM